MPHVPAVSPILVANLQRGDRQDRVDVAQMQSVASSVPLRLHTPPLLQVMNFLDGMNVIGLNPLPAAARALLGRKSPCRHQKVVPAPALLDQLLFRGVSLHDFNKSDGWYPYSGVTLDAQGNVYGTTWLGGLNNDGTMYQLVHSGSGWTLNTLYAFQNSADGENPLGQVVFDQAGNLYGSTQAGGTGGGGTVFELSPSGGGWNFAVLYSLPGNNDGPIGSVALDAAGNIYGTTYGDGDDGYGNVFKLTRTDGGWSYTSLHDFTGGSDGANPVGGVTLDDTGNMYGTAYQGGPTHCPQGCGVVWEITP